MREERPDLKVSESWVCQDRDVPTGEKRDTSGAWTFTRELAEGTFASQQGRRSQTRSASSGVSSTNQRLRATTTTIT